jgi:hypothetical protein
VDPGPNLLQKNADPIFGIMYIRVRTYGFRDGILERQF